MKSFHNIEAYLNAAVASARYESIDDGQTIYAEIPAFPGVWASGSTREEVVAELKSVLEGWIELQTERDQPLPQIQGVDSPRVSFA